MAAVDGQLNDCLRQNPRGINCECANIQECNRAPPCIKTRASRNHSAPSRHNDFREGRLTAGSQRGLAYQKPEPHRASLYARSTTNSEVNHA